MSKAYRTIIVDPEDQSIVEYDQWLDIFGIRKLLGTDNVIANIIKMPDDSLVAAYSPAVFAITDTMFTFQAKDKVPLRGTTIFIGLDPLMRGTEKVDSILNFTDCPFALQDAKKLIKWISVFDS